jgi:outer membrane protein
LLACLIFPAASFSQTLSEENLEETPFFSLDNVNLNVGGGVGIGPAYQGSDHYKVHPITIGSFSYRNTLFVGPAGAGANFLNIKGLRAGPVLGYRGGRKQTTDARLQGLGNIGASIEAGLFIDYDVGPFTMSGTYRHALTHSNNGAIGRFQLDYRSKMLDDKLELHLGPEVDFGDGRYVKTWFGVSPAQAVTSHLPVYAPEGGATGAGLYVTMDYYLSSSFFLHSFGSVRQLAGDTAGSPIVAQKTQAYAGLGLVYHWSGHP